MQKLLTYYQLWMHDVFPKARFRDCISMTKNIGNTKPLKIMRREWIELSKPTMKDDRTFDEIFNVNEDEGTKQVQESEQDGKILCYCC